jgi:hypothetical protein
VKKRDRKTIVVFLKYNATLKPKNQIVHTTEKSTIHKIYTNRNQKHDPIKNKS